MVTNYRPISLMNCDYKLLAYILVGRMEECLPMIIHPSETAYMKGHFIGTNIKFVQDTIMDTVNNNKETVVLFLDFKKAFDSVNHLFMLMLLHHMGFLPLFVAWIMTLYKQVSSCVRHKNWLMESFYLGRGVCQGCPLSCHLFNLVGQVLMYSLKDSGYFEWWVFVGDPCSLYADDTAIFLRDLSMLPAVINHIQWVGTFTGLTLNIDKTIAFDPNAAEKLVVVDVQVQSHPVKYLGIYLGLGDLI